ncbi:MAG: protein translocase subunit SecD [Alphaproteobacteria bacterium]|nr:protein translocase subunit SecD [Alphaproteobacteria bacterium]
MYPSRLKLFSYFLIFLIGTLIALPNVLSKETLDKFPAWMPKKAVTLGLDLRGGSHLVLEVDTAALKRDRAEGMVITARQILRNEKVAGTSVRQDGEGVIVKFNDEAKAPEIRKLLANIAGDSQSLFATGQVGLDVTELSANELRFQMSEAMVAERVNNAIDQSLEIVRRRIDEVGVAEPSIQRLGQERIVVQLPGVQDPTRIKELLGSTAKLSFHLVDMNAPQGQRAAPTARTITLPDADGQTYHTIESEALIQGDRLVDAQSSFNQTNGTPVVTFQFDAIGAKTFADVTTKNTGKPFAIVLDGKVLSAPRINEPITMGRGEISGSFTQEETVTLSALMRAGALPAPLHIIEERTVGPDLGGDAIKMGALSGLAGFGLVFVFMVLIYGRWGLLANIALAMNVVLTFAALSLLGATLTLPGIAGIVLGIGIAVDANVLINERIREETALGRSAIAALDSGFNRAYSTIVDSNVTTLIATLLLFAFGSGPVKGFAVTMGIGIAISMFTAVTVVRAIMATWVHKKRPKKFIIDPLFSFLNFSDQPNIKFMSARKWGIGVSLFLSVASIFLFIKPGLNYGIDFVGGILVEVKTPQETSLGELRSGLEASELGEIALQEFGSENHVLIRIEQPKEATEQAQMAVVEKARASIEQIAPGSSIERVEMVGPKLSGELAYTGILAVVLASIAMLLYIWFRFEWQFALGAIATLVLDVTKTVGFFALFQIDFNLTAIAALLTLIGYSVNDKVVVYDRMRENLRKYKKMKLEDLINLSINSTLKRSIYTSATALFAMLPMAIWGGSAVSSFAIPMIFGIFIAASSSIFIAAPILLYFGEGKLGYRSGENAAEDDGLAKAKKA